MECFAIKNSEAFKLLNKLGGNTKVLSLKIFSYLSENYSDIMRFSQICADKDFNLCTILLKSPSKEYLQFKIEIFENYFDFFADDLEIAIQQNILPVDSAIDFIKRHLSSTIKEVCQKDLDGNILNRKITFFNNDNEQVNEIGTVSLIKILFKRKKIKNINYESWVVK